MTPTTFKREDMVQGVEPDDSFYIQNSARMIGKERIDLSVDPPPDLAIEVDVTSKTQVDVYEALSVPELWRYEDGKLQINILHGGKYVESKISQIFPDLPICEVIPQFIEESKASGRGLTLKKFREWIEKQTNSGV